MEQGPKVALLLYGQPRHVCSNDRVYLSHRHWILDRYPTEVYCHYWYEPGCVYQLTNWTGPPTPAIPSSEQTPQVIRDRYQPIAVEADPPMRFPMPDKYQTEPKLTKWPYYNAISYNNILSQLCSIERVAKLVAPRASDYDWIVVTRYDIILDEFPDLKGLDRRYFYQADIHSRFPDLVYIFPPQFLASQYTYSHFDKIVQQMLTSDTSRYWDFSPECLKYNSYLLHYDRALIRQTRIREHRNDDRT
jgi:hypothetical protein